MSKDTFDKVLVAFDGSDYAAKAVRTACSLVRHPGASLTVVHVYAVPIYPTAMPLTMPPESIAALADSAKLRATEIMGRGLQMAEREGVKARSEILEAASTVQAIVEYGANEKFDLIVLGTRGVTGFRKLLLGSVSSGVVSHAESPVLVVR